MSINTAHNEKQKPIQCHESPDSLLLRGYPIVTFSTNYFVPQLAYKFRKGEIKHNFHKQRRVVWGVKQKSLLIESLFLDLPIPVLFFYQINKDQYEIVDGLQRISAIVDFYNNDLRLGNDVMDGLKKKKFADLNESCQAKFKRIKLDATVVVPTKEAQENLVENKIRGLIFERFNTGGVKLNRQEVRHVTYPGKFNELLHAITKSKIFTEIFGIPPYPRNSGDTPNRKNKRWYNYGAVRRMRDCEHVLRFFAFKDLNPPDMGKGVTEILNDAMVRHYQSDLSYQEDKKTYCDLLRLCRAIFQSRTFKNPHNTKTKNRIMIAVYDAAMLSLHEWSKNMNSKEFSNFRANLVANKDDILERYIGAFSQGSKNNLNGKYSNRYQTVNDLLTGKNPTGQGVMDRKNFFSEEIWKFQ